MSDNPDRKVAQIELWYPNIHIENRTDQQPTDVQVGLTHVRAADDLYIDYDFQRDGYRIRVATVWEWEVDDEVCDPKLKEVAFIPAWSGGHPE